MDDYWLTGEDHILLMHRIIRPEKSYSEFCVGEAFQNDNGYWEIRIAVYTDVSDKSGQILVGISDSPVMAREVLWEQRNLMHWGTFQ